MKKLRLFVEATSCDGAPSGALRRHLELWPRVLEGSGGALDLRVLVSPAAREVFAGRLDPKLLVEVPDTPAGPVGRLRVNRELRDLVARARGSGEIVVHQETLPLALPRQTILCRHDGRIHRLGLSSLPRRLYAGLKLRGQVRGLKALITVSASSAAELARALGVEIETIRIVPNGIDPAALVVPADLEPRLAALGLERGGYRLVLGHRERRKNPYFAIELEATLRARNFGGRLVLAGRDTGEDGAIRRHADRLGLRDRLLILDRPDDDLRSVLLAGAQCVLVPSILEGFSMVTLEALAVGAPLICSDIPAHREVVGDPYCLPLGIADWREALFRLRDSAEERNRQASSGRERVAAWTWDAAAAAMLALLEEL
ncbi:MAG: glycosyltransferase [Planctomycetes bacterium]|nr:glycosyltransferase [Planctomycetota bacterium]